MDNAPVTAVTRPFRLTTAALSCGQLNLLEVNAFPAICSGTMTDVPAQVYTRLVRDIITLAVLPALGAQSPEPGGFERLAL